MPAVKLTTAMQITLMRVPRRLLSEDEDEDSSRSAVSQIVCRLAKICACMRQQAWLQSRLFLRSLQAAT